MNDFLINGVVFINRIFTVTAGNFLKFLNVFPYWISLGLISCLVGFVFIPIFKYFSNQRAVRRIRNTITADLLSIRIFKDNPIVMIRAQGRILLGSFRLLWVTLPSLLIMIVPVTFLLTQMSGWYQFRPLRIGEIAVITVKTASGIDHQEFDIHMDVPGSVDVLAGPIWIHSRNELIWTISGRTSGSGFLYFTTPQDTFTKKLDVGESKPPVSIRVPERTFGEIFLYPFETPPVDGSPIRSISLEYGDTIIDPAQRFDWLLVFCIVSMLVFWMFKRFFKVVV